MKNLHIKNLKEVVPKEIRLQVYKDALSYYKSENYERLGKVLGFGLCLSLPVHLWELSGFEELNPEGQKWDYEDTSLAFPELTKSVINKISDIEEGENQTIKRVYYLEQWISNLENN